MAQEPLLGSPPLLGCPTAQLLVLLTPQCPSLRGIIVCASLCVFPLQLLTYSDSTYTVVVSLSTCT